MRLGERQIGRRAFIGSLLGAGLAGAHQAKPGKPKDHFPFGPLGTPRTLKAWPVHKQDGSAASLSEIVKGRVSALQLMFTSCNATCPIQGALFSKVQKQIGTSIPDAQYLSLSIDPETDTPAEMTAWLKKFGAASNWLGLSPRPVDVASITNVLGENGEPQTQASDPHSGQIYLISRRGQLVYRTASLPSAKEVVHAMQEVAKLKIG